MGSGQLRTLITHLRRSVNPVGSDVLGDAQLLSRWTNERDEAAFELLLWRHGPMVLAVCRRVLHSRHDIEDAFQAAFLTLVRKAPSIRRPEAVAAWLHRVAYRIALRLRSDAAECARRSQSDVETLSLDETEVASYHELRAVLDEEINALPEGCRQAFVLCCLEGKTHAEAARQLGRPAGTISCWLKRGRERLRGRLLRRGLAPAAALPICAESQAQADLSSALVETTRRTARALALGGKGVAATTSPRVTRLVEGALNGMTASRLHLRAMLVLMLGLAGAGIGVLSYPAATQQPDPAQAPRTESADARQPRLEATGRTDRHGDPLPSGAVARLGTARLRHDHIYGGLATAIPPDGKTLATGGTTSLRLWSMATGKKLWELHEHYQYASLRFSPGGKYLATWAGDAVCLLEPANGRLLRRIAADGPVAAFSPDSKRFVTSSSDGTMSVWETATGRRVFRLREHKQTIGGAVFTADGRSLVSMCLGKRLCRWDMTTGELRKALDVKFPQHRTWCLSPDGQTLAVVPYSRDPVRLYDTETGEQRGVLEGPQAAAGYGLAFSADSRTLATDWSEPWADKDGTISLWDARTGKLRRRFAVPAGVASHLEFAPDGRTLVSAGSEPQVRLWDTVSGRQLLTWPAHNGWVEQLAFTPDGRRLVSCDREAVRVWELESAAQQQMLPREGQGRLTFALLPDGRTLLSGARLELDVRDLSSGEKVRRLILDEHPEKLPRPEFFLPGHHVQQIGLTADGRTAACLSSVAIEAAPRVFRNAHEVHVWDVGTGRVLTHRELESSAQPLGFAPGLSALIGWNSTLPPLTEKRMRDEFGTFRFLFEDVRTGRHLLTLPQPDNGFTQYAVSADGRTFVSATAPRTRDGRDLGRQTIHFWELASAKERLAIRGREAGHPAHYEWFAFAPDGCTLAAARVDHTLQIFDAVSGEELLRRTGCPGPVSSLAFSPDGKLLATGLRDSSILLWQMPAPGTLRAITDAKQLEQGWSALAGDDARAAGAAVWQLAATPRQVVPMLRQRLRPVSPPPADEVRRLLADLDSTEFDKREAATKALAALGDPVVPMLVQAQKEASSPEKRRRIADLLPTSEIIRSPELLRQVRAVEILEHIGTAEARQVLQTLADGMPDARLTREARASLQRLTNRRAAAP
jgi:RNA polymerase sigma factor (sigma-70 family)